jgi:aquaporin Z
MGVLPEDFPKYLSEFVGTYILVLTVGCNVLGGTAIWAVTSIACSLMVGIYALGSVSGAHFNPAVTLAILLSNKMPGGWQEAAKYMAVQVAGGICAGLTYLSIFQTSFNLGPGKGHGWLAAGMCELIYTCMLCFTVLNVALASAQKDNQFYGLAIGFVIVAGGYAVGTVSGAAFNPAVAFGVDVASASQGFGYSVIYTLFQFVGAGIAAALFRLVRAEDFGAPQKNALSAVLVSEFVGTFFLTVTVGFNVLTASAAGAWSIGAALMCMVYALGNCSGGHFNPAVTLAVLLSGRNKIETQMALKYMGAQVLGAVAAGLVYVGILGQSFRIAPGLSWTKTGLGEIIFTALLCFVVLSVATTSKPSKDMFGLTIGNVITAAGFAGAAMGVVLNPAVGIGVDFANLIKGGTFGASIPFAALEAFGAAAAVGLFKTVRPGEYGKALP